MDAQVALEFHEKRLQAPSLFISQFVNKLWYSRVCMSHFTNSPGIQDYVNDFPLFQFGAKNAFVRTCAGLSNNVRLECDGKVVELPQGTEGIIMLNIASYVSYFSHYDYLYRFADKWIGWWVETLA